MKKFIKKYWWVLLILVVVLLSIAGINWYESVEHLRFHPAK